MTNTNKEVHKRDDRQPQLFVEDATAIGIPFLDPEFRCESCGTRWHPESVEPMCVSCDSYDVVEDSIGALDFVGKDLDGGGDRNGTCRVLIRESEAPQFFGQLDRALRVNFGVRLAALDGSDPELRKKIGICEG